MKYAPLREHLARAKGNELQLSFAELERILGFTLPKSAYTYKEWWANKKGGHSQTDAWIAAGWDIDNVALKFKKVTFVRRTPMAGKSRPRTTRTLMASTRPGPHAWDTEVEHSCFLQMKWVPLGCVIIDDDGRLEFPTADKAPGLYRIKIKSGSKQHMYVGEAVNLKRRFGNYRRPGGNQKTSIRINKTLLDALKAGAEVSVATACAVLRGPIATKCVDVDLSLKAERRLFESLAQVMSDAFDTESLNR